jgi:hypothetical protein
MLAVHDAVAVRFRHRAGHRRGNLDGAPRRERPARDQVAQVLTLHQLHHHVRVVFVHSVVVDGGNGGVGERRGSPGFAQQTLAMLSGGAGELDRHTPAQQGVLGQVDHAHAAFTELLQDPVMRERFAQQRPSQNCALG